MSELYVSRVTSVHNSHFYQACKRVLRGSCVSITPPPHRQHHWSMHVWECLNQPPSEFLTIKNLFFSRALTAFAIRQFLKDYCYYYSYHLRGRFLSYIPPTPNPHPQSQKTHLKGFKAWHFGSCFVNNVIVISWGRRREEEKGVCW